jgi:hypothetical protein
MEVVIQEVVVTLVVDVPTMAITNASHAQIFPNTAGHMALAHIVVVIVIQNVKAIKTPQRSTISKVVVQPIVDRETHDGVG